jgi:hypothetical protein
VNAPLALSSGTYEMRLDIPRVDGEVLWGEVAVGDQETVLFINSGVQLVPGDRKVWRWRVTPAGITDAEVAKQATVTVSGQTPAVPLPPGRYRVAASIEASGFVDLTPAEGVEVPAATIVDVAIGDAVPKAQDRFAVSVDRQTAAPGETIALNVRIPAAANTRLSVMTPDGRWRFAPAWNGDRIPKTAQELSGELQFRLPEDAAEGEYLFLLEWLAVEGDEVQRLAMTMETIQVSKDLAGSQALAQDAVDEAAALSCPADVTVSGHLERNGQRLAASENERRAVELRRLGGGGRMRVEAAGDGSFDIPAQPGAYVIYAWSMDSQRRMAQAPGRIIEVGCEGQSGLVLQLSEPQPLTPEPDQNAWRLPPLVPSAWAECPKPEKPAQECPCGKLPVCVLSGNERSGLGSLAYSDMTDGEVKLSSWKGFGLTRKRRAINALMAEKMFADALQESNPCLDVISVDYDYGAGTVDIVEKAEKAYDEIDRLMRKACARWEDHFQVEFRECEQFDYTRLTEDERQQLESLKEEFKRLVEQVKAVALQAIMTPLSCPAQIVMGGEYPWGGEPRVSARLLSETPGMDEVDSTYNEKVEQGWGGKLAEGISPSMEQLRKQWFCECELHSGYCITTDFELSNQQYRCDGDISCCGEVTQRFSEEGFGLRAGGGSHYVTKCCGEGATALGGDTSSKELKEFLHCQGTGTLRARDLDCDGLANYEDPSPLPTEEELERLKP